MSNPTDQDPNQSAEAAPAPPVSPPVALANVAMRGSAVDSTNRLDSINQPVLRIESNSREAAKGYISDKLLQPRMQKLRVEVMGGNARMTQMFGTLLKRKPDALQELIGEACNPLIQDPARFVNAKMTEMLG